MNLNGKRALVTGGSSGIGREIARELLLAGATVGVTGRRQDAIAPCSNWTVLGRSMGCRPT